MKHYGFGYEFIAFLHLGFPFSSLTLCTFSLEPKMKPVSHEPTSP